MCGGIVSRRMTDVAVDDGPLLSQCASCSLVDDEFDLGASIVFQFHRAIVPVHCLLWPVGHAEPKQLYPRLVVGRPDKEFFVQTTRS